MIRYLIALLGVVLNSLLLGYMGAPYWVVGVIGGLWTAIVMLIATYLEDRELEGKAPLRCLCGLHSWEIQSNETLKIREGLARVSIHRKCKVCGKNHTYGYFYQDLN